MIKKDMPLKDISVLKEFLSIPVHSADGVFDRFAALPGAIIRGKGQERFLYVPGTRQNKVLLVAHADTYWCHKAKADWTEQNLVQEGHIIRNANGGLGADDRAGCAIIWQLRELGHSILIVDGEESGLLGSFWLMNHNQDIAEAINNDHQFMVEFDRSNGREFKCYGVGTDAFREFVRMATGYTEPDRMRRSDIVALCKRIAGVNLSMGSLREHTKQEALDVREWQRTLDICREWLGQKKLALFMRDEEPVMLA